MHLTKTQIFMLKFKSFESSILTDLEIFSFKWTVMLLHARFRPKNVIFSTYWVQKKPDLIWGPKRDIWLLDRSRWLAVTKAILLLLYDNISARESFEKISQYLIRLRIPYKIVKEPYDRNYLTVEASRYLTRIINTLL